MQLNNSNIPRPSVFRDDTEETIDIKRFLSLFISNWLWFVLALVFALMVAYLVNRYSEKAYTVSSSLLIKDDQTSGYSSSLANVLPGGDIFSSQQNLVNEMAILRSFSLNYKVMQELPEFQVVYMAVGKRGIVETKLYKNSPFRVLCASVDNQPQEVRVDIKIISENKYILSIEGMIDKVNVDFSDELSFGERFSKFGFDFSIIKRFGDDYPILTENGSNEYWFYFIGKEKLASIYKNKLSVSPIEEDASLVTLSVTGPNFNQEIDYLNTLMDVYIRYGLENKNQTADSTIVFIEKQLAIILDSLDNAEEQLESFRRNNSVVDISREGSAIQTRLENIQKEKLTYEMQLQYYEYLSEYLKEKYADGTVMSPSVMGINDPILVGLVNDLSDLQKDISKMGFNLSGDQPAFELLEKQLNATRASLSENVANGIRTLNVAIDESNRRIELVENDLKSLPATERQLITINRNYDLNNSVYTYLLEKRSESEIARASTVSDNRIIDEASYYSTVQIRPKTKKNWLIAIMLGLIIPAAALLIIDLLNNKIVDKNDIEKRTVVPVIGVIGHSDSKASLPVVEKPGSSLAESFRSVRTSIKYFVQENKTATIAITSTISSEGKSFVSSNLAAILAMLGKKVLVVGLDLRMPRLTKLFNYTGDEGMSTYLSNNSDYDSLIHSTEVENLYFAPAGPVPPNPAELIESPRMAEFIERAREEYDYVIFDTPPVGVVTDTLLVAPYIDVNIFIVRQRYSSRETLDLIEQYYREGNMKRLAIILNDVKEKGYYGYGMRYSYTYGYGYNYGNNYYGNEYNGKYGQKNKGYYRE